MSTQSEREAAARAWFKDPSKDGGTLLLSLCKDHEPGGYRSPHPFGMMATGTWCLSRWLAWAKADAAKPAPVAPDPLEGVVLADPAHMLAWTESGRQDPYNFGCVTPDCYRVWRALRGSGLSWNHARPLIAAHARAQLAREAHEAAPAQPAAMTLEQARAMCREAGDTVVEAEWVSAPAVLRYCDAVEAWGAAQDAERAAFMALCEEDRRKFSDGIADPPTVAAILRALGVTPAVLK